MLCVSSFFANLPNCTTLNTASTMTEESNSTNTTEGIGGSANATEEANLTLLQGRLK